MARRTTVLAVVAIVAATSVASGGPVTAGPIGSVAQVSDLAALDLARERGVSLAEAERRIGWQQRAHELQDVLASALREDQFGGLWIGDDDDRIKVGVVDAGFAANTTAGRTIGGLAADHGLADAVDIVRVRHSLAALTRANDWLGGELERVNNGAPWPLQAGYVTDESTVRLGLPPRAQELTPAQRALIGEAKRRLGPMLSTYSYTDRITADACLFPYCDPPLRAGVRINPVGCTLGFLGRSRSDGKLYAFTAGHCLDGSSSTIYSTHFSDGSVHNIGPRHNFVYGTGGDAGIIRVTNEAGWRARAWVYVWPSTGNDGVGGTAYDAEYPITGDGASSLNMRICKSGVSPDRTSCGRVKELGVTVTYTSGVTVRNLARTSYCSMGGDSGGPVYASNTAYGIHVAGSSGCVAYYQGIRGAENAMNVNVSFD